MNNSATAAVADNTPPDSFDLAFGAMDDIEEGTKGLEDDIKAVADVAAQVQAIAKQTNLLALNATIEAARAGDAGKGFAVVATEVKQLSDETSKATNQIGDTLKSLTAKLEQFVSQTEAARRSIEVAREQASISVPMPEPAPVAEEVPQPVETPPASEPAPIPEPEAVATPEPTAGAAEPAKPSPSSDLPVSQTELGKVQQSFIAVALDSDPVAEMFYTRLFETHPEMTDRFSGDMKTYGHQPLEIVGAAIAGMLTDSDILPVLGDLGQRYREYGVEVSDYAAVAEALMWTLEQKMAADFTPDIREAWVNFYALIAETMIKGPNA